MNNYAADIKCIDAVNSVEWEVGDTREKNGPGSETVTMAPTDIIVVPFIDDMPLRDVPNSAMFTKSSGKCVELTLMFIW